MKSYLATILRFSAIISKKLIAIFFQITQNCSTLLSMCKWKGTIHQCDKYFKQSLSRDGLCCSFNYYTFPDTTTLDKYKHYFCKVEGEFLSFIKDWRFILKNKKLFSLINKKILRLWDKNLLYDFSNKKFQNRKVLLFYFTLLIYQNKNC